MNKIILISLLLVGCGESITASQMDSPLTDQCLRKVYFDECLSKIPEGPKVSHYNDLSEAIESCENVSHRMSYRIESQIKKECLSGYRN